MKLTPRDVCGRLQGPCSAPDTDGIIVCAFCYCHRTDLNIPVMVQAAVRDEKDI